jgi:hypothetical protein
MSSAVTIQALFLFNFSHSTQMSFFSKTSHFRFNIISTIESLIQGNVEYSWLTHFTFIPVILVPGIDDKSILLREFPKVTQYHFGNGPTVNIETFSSKSF